MQKSVILLFLTICSIFSCTKQDACLQYTTNSALARFRTYTDTLSLKDTVMPNPLAVYSNFAIAFPASTQCTFTLNGQNTFTEVYLYPDSSNLATVDTLLFYYQPQLNFVSKECGFNYFYTIDSVKSTGKYIKKINVLNPEINNKVNTLHLELVY